MITTDSRSRNVILLVEDEIIVGCNEKLQLERAGYSVHHVASGQDAVDYVLEGAHRVDLILMDIDLGSGMDGTQAAREILAQRDLPILFVSSHTEEEIVRRTEEISSYGYVVKHSDQIVLLASIKMAFRLFDAKQKIKVSEERYAKAFHTSPDAVNINRLDDGVYIAINQGFTQIMGYSEAEVLGKSSVDPEFQIWVDPEDRRTLVRKLHEAGSVTNFRTRFKAKNGDVKWGLMSARVLQIEEATCILSITRDIGDVVEAESKMRSSEERYRQLAQSSHDWIWEVDATGVYTYASEHSTDLLGYTPEELLGKTPFDLMPPDEVKRVGELFGAFVAKKDPFRNLENHNIHKDGHVVILETNGVPILDDQGTLMGYRGMDRDITARKQAEYSLRESEERFVRLSEDTPGYICSCTPTGVMTYVNPALAAITGKQPGDLIGQCFLDLLAEDERAHVRKVLDDLCPSSPIETHEQSFSDSRGVLHWQQWTNRGFFDAQGRILRILSIGIDITERKHMEEMLRRRTQELQLILDTVPASIWFKDTYNRFLRVNRAGAQMIGRDVSDIDGHDAREVFPIPLADKYYQDDLEVITTGNPKLGIEEEYATARGERRWARTDKVPWLDDQGKISGVLAFAIDTTDARRAQDDLKRSREAYRKLFNDHAAMEMILDPEDGSIVDANTAALQFYGWTRKELLGMKISQINILPPDEVHARMAEAQKARRHHFEFRHRRADGSVRDVDVFTSSVELDGRMVLHSIIHDTTERKCAEEKIVALLAQKEMLLREVHHRIKNNMMIIDSLLSLHAHSSHSPETVAALTDASNRLKVMRVLYEKLYRGESFTHIPAGDYLSPLIDEIVGVFPNHASIVVEKRIENIPFDSRVLVPLGIMINELITNAMKHGFVGRNHGRLQVMMTKAENFILQVRDDGNGLSSDRAPSGGVGSGTVLIESLAAQLDGKFSIEDDHGTVCTVVFPPTRVPGAP